MAKSTTYTVENPTYTHTFPEKFTVLDELVNEMPIRKPNGLDLLQVGTPVMFDSETGKAELDLPRCYRMTARLSGYPESILLRIDPAEILDLFWLVASFFMKGRQTLLPALEKQKAGLSRRAGSPEHSQDGSSPDNP